jgi:hypothetical protein
MTERGATKENEQDERKWRKTKNKQSMFFKEAGIPILDSRMERKKTRLSTSSPGLVLSLLTKCPILFPCVLLCVYSFSQLFGAGAVVRRTNGTCACQRCFPFFFLFPQRCLISISLHFIPQMDCWNLLV